MTTTRSAIGRPAYCLIRRSDGTVGELNGAGTCTASHVYVGDGPYTIRFTLTDDDGAADTETTTATIHRSVFVLSPSVCGALTMSGNAVVDVQGRVAVNSNCASAITASRQRTAERSPDFRGGRR